MRRKGGLSLLPRALQMLFEYPYDMTAGFLQSNQSKRQQGRNHNAFYDLAFMTHCHSHHIFLVKQISPGSLYKRSTQGCEEQEIRIVGNHLGGWLPQPL